MGGAKSGRYPKSNAGLNNYRSIRDHILNGGGLNEKQQEILDRYTDLYNLVKRHGQNKKVILRAYKALKKKSDDLPSDIHIMRDMRSSLQLFGDVDRINKNILQTMIIDDLYEDIQNLKALSELSLKRDGAGDLLGLDGKSLEIYERLIKLKNTLTKNLIEAAGVNRITPDMPDFTKLEAHTYVLDIDPMAKKLLDMIARGQKGSFMDLREFYDISTVTDAEIIENE